MSLVLGIVIGVVVAAYVPVVPEKLKAAVNYIKEKING